MCNGKLGFQVIFWTRQMFDCVFTYRENTRECSKSREYLVHFEPGFMFTSSTLQRNEKLKKNMYVKKERKILLMWRAKFSLFDLWTDMSVCSGRKCQLVWLSQRVSGDVGRKWSGHAMGSRRGQQLRIQVRNSSRLLLCWSAILILLSTVYGETNKQQYHTVCCYEAVGFGVENHSQEVCKDCLIKRKDLNSHNKISKRKWQYVNLGRVHA